MTTRTKIVLWVAAVSAVVLSNPSGGTAAELADRRKAFQEYLAKFDNAKATVQFREVQRIPEGRVQETVSKGEWRARNGEHRASYYVEKAIDGKKEVYDIRDALVGRDVAVVWFHAGFPGEVHFGKTAARGGTDLAVQTQHFVGALRVTSGLRRWFDDPAARLEVLPGGDEVVSVPTPHGDQLEIHLAKRHGFLPVRVRRPGISKVDKRYLDGWGVEIEYAPGPDGTPLPQRIVRDEPLAPGHAGTVLWEWTFTPFELNPAPAEDEAKLFIPSTVTVKNEDTGETFRIDEDTPRARAFRDQLPATVKVVSQKRAVVELSKTAAGKAPYYPKGFFDVGPLDPEEEAAPPQPVRRHWWHWALGGACVTSLLAAGTWRLRARRTHVAETSASGAPGDSGTGAK
jgi:hypothetical protein